MIRRWRQVAYILIAAGVVIYFSDQSSRVDHVAIKVQTDTDKYSNSQKQWISKQMQIQEDYAGMDGRALASMNDFAAIGNQTHSELDGAGANGFLQRRLAALKPSAKLSVNKPDGNSIKPVREMRRTTTEYSAPESWSSILAGNNVVTSKPVSGHQAISDARNFFSGEPGPQSPRKVPVIPTAESRHIRTDTVIAAAEGHHHRTDTVVPTARFGAARTETRRPAELKKLKVIQEAATRINKVFKMGAVSNDKKQVLNAAVEKAKQWANRPGSRYSSNDEKKPQFRVLTKQSHPNGGNVTLAPEDIEERRSHPEKSTFSAKKEAIFEKRQRDVTQACYKYYSYAPNSSYVPYREISYNFILSDDLHKVLYCSVPKAASTNWRRVLLFMSSNMSSDENSTRYLNPNELEHDTVHNLTEYPPNIRPLSSLTPHEVAKRLQTYTKVMFVRNPVERLLSAYKDKFAKYNKFYSEVMGRYIISRYRENATYEEITAGYPVTLNEFLLFMRDEGFVRGDVHWANFHTHCLSCVIPYDYVGKVETLAEDATYILNHVFDFPMEFPTGSGLPTQKTPPPANPTATRKTAKPKETPLDVARRTIRPELLQYIAEEYRMDYEMFGYSMPNFFRKRKKQGTKNDFVV